MDAAAAIALRALEGDLLDRVIRRHGALDPTPQFDDETTRQFVNGLMVIVREAAEGGGREARDLYTATAAAAVVADGRSVESLVQTLVLFGVVVGDELGRALPAEDAVAASEWFAGFLGGWSAELIAAMGEL